MSAETCADVVVRERLTALDLRQAFLDFPHEPTVVIQQALDGLAHQRLCVGPALLGKAREPGLLLRRERHVHGSSVPELGRAGGPRTGCDPRARHPSVRVRACATDAAGEVDVCAVLGSVKAPLRGPCGLRP